MIDKKKKNNIGLFIMNDGEWQSLGKAEELNLVDEEIFDCSTFNPQIREECTFLLNDKPLKIYFRTKNKRIKKKQIKKSPLLKMILELKKCVGISEVAKNVK